MHLHAASMAEVRMMDGAEPVSSDQLSVIGMAGGARPQPPQMVKPAGFLAWGRAE
jgi:hypothetical protein